jgi:prepilin-type N-terminal cleavage/methylation domain-containing protein
MIKLKVKSKKSKVSKSGFTLVELLVSISILSIAILATFTAITNNFRSSNFSQDQVIAYYLADEGIEFVRNMRDNNGIKNIQLFGSGGTAVDWLSGIASVSGDPCYGKSCIVDAPSNTISSCTSNTASCPVLRKDSTTGLYGYTASWTPTQFKRSVDVTVLNSTEAKVSVTVSWTTDGVSKNYVLSEMLKNWQ